MSMLGKEDASGGGGPEEPHNLSDPRKTFWRSASWSSSRSALPPLNNESEGKSRRLLPPPLTPRTQCKARSCLPPLQPLSIARRSLDEWPKAGSDDVEEWPVPITPGGRDLNKGGDRLKLDLSTIQRTSEKNGGLVKREKIAFFDKECSKVAEHIYLGGDAVAKNRELLKRNCITHILNCVGFACSEYFRADFAYRTLWLQDSFSEDITSILYDVFDYFEEVREQDGRVFVHCCQGVSRSTSLVIAYLMWREGQSFDDAFRYVKAARGIADPNMGFACQLLQCQKRVHAVPLSPSSLLRIYRMAPHSPYDPLHLVPKMLIDPSPSLLDSRGTFIIHIPSGIYVWIGKKCDTIMERDARGAVCQIIRYEKVQGPITVINEGEEPSCFWDAFSNFLPLMNKSGNGLNLVESSVKNLPGERKVNSYDIDYEIFRKAIKGGFVPPFSSYETEHETHLPARENSWSVMRRKFASGNMKDFVTAAKVAPTRVFPNLFSVSSVDNLPASQLLSSDSSSSSSSTSPYLSPDSISADSIINSKCLSESPAASPLIVPECNPHNSNSSRSSNFITLPSSQFITKTSEFIDVNFTTGLRSQSASLPFKRSHLSIAERRGSLSKCLTLPVRIDDSSPRENIIPSNSVINHPGHSSRNIDSVHSQSKVERDIIRECELQGSSCASVDVRSCCERSPLLETSDEFCKTHHLVKNPSCFSELLASVLELNKPTKAEIYQWPGLEKVVTFDSKKMESEAFIFVTSCSDIGKTKDKVVYLWISKSFKHSQSNSSLDNLEETNWNQVCSEISAHMDLPAETTIKVVKEDMEPAELLDLLRPF